MVIEANRIFKLKRAVLLLETCALKLQKRWLKHRYPFGLPKYRHKRDEAAMLLQASVITNDVVSQHSIAC